MLICTEPSSKCLPRSRIFSRIPIEVSSVAGPDPVISRQKTRPRKIPLSYGGHVCGHHPVRPDHGAIRFESLVERDFIDVVAKSPALIRIESQPLTMNYSLAGKNYRYTPDFLIRLAWVPEELGRLGLCRETLVECKAAEVIGEKELQILRRNFRAIQKMTSTPIVLIVRAGTAAARLGGFHG